MKNGRCRRRKARGISGLRRLLHSAQENQMLPFRFQWPRCLKWALIQERYKPVQTFLVETRRIFHAYLCALRLNRDDEVALRDRHRARLQELRRFSRLGGCLQLRASVLCTLGQVRGVAWID